MPVDHYENFPVASLLLPAHLRAPIEVIYAFARSADDFADEGDLPDAERLALLDGYKAELEKIERGGTDLKPLFVKVAAVVKEHDVPIQLLYDLLDAFSQDVVKKRYATFADVLDYCRRSANPIGRLLVHLNRRATPENLSCSDSICSALQLINFWQDVDVDWAKDRVYLPQEDLARFGVTEKDIAERADHAAWRALMAFQCRRAREMLESGRPLTRALPGRMGLELRLVLAGGNAILDKIEAVQGDVFRFRPVLTKWDWLKAAPGALFA
jgi:squalene synthase HpnC